MKGIFSFLGLALLVAPLLRHESFESRVSAAGSASELVATILGAGGGLTCGCAGIMLLGFVCDGGRGYGNRGLLFAMTVIGIAWCCLYPCGWLVGGPLIVYSLARRFGATPQKFPAETSDP